MAYYIKFSKGIFSTYHKSGDWKVNYKLSEETGPYYSWSELEDQLRNLDQDVEVIERD